MAVTVYQECALSLGKARCSGIATPKHHASAEAQGNEKTHPD